MVWQIQWPSAAPGSTQSLRCPGEGNTIGYGLAHRSCWSGGIWGLVNATACESAAVQEVRMKVFNVFIYMYIISCTSIYNCHTANVQMYASIFRSLSQYHDQLLLFELQTKSLLAGLNQTLSDGLPILEADRLKVERLSVTLRDALNHSTIENSRSVLPRDLETATNFVEIVAKLVCLSSIYWLAVNFCTS